MHTTPMPPLTAQIKMLLVPPPFITGNPWEKLPGQMTQGNLVVWLHPQKEQTKRERQTARRSLVRWGQIPLSVTLGYRKVEDDREVPDTLPCLLAEMGEAPGRLKHTLVWAQPRNLCHQKDHARVSLLNVSTSLHSSDCTVNASAAWDVLLALGRHYFRLAAAESM